MKHSAFFKIYLSLLAALAVLAVVLCAVWLAKNGEAKPVPPMYLLKDHAGHVALYTGEGDGPLADYPSLYTRLLPEQDVLALQQGVPVQNEQELERRLEDYGL